MPAILAEGLRSEILDGTIRPGQRINVRQLGGRLKVSFIPIREAVRLIEAEGLIETKPYVGARATEVSLVELEDVYELRRMIEPAVARRAVERTSAQHAATVRKCLERLEELEKVTEGIDSDLIVAHRDFHRQLLAPGMSSLIERTLRGLWRISERYVRLTQGAAMPVADTQHAQMVELLERRDGDALVDLVNEHLHLAANALTILYGQDPAA